MSQTTGRTETLRTDRSAIKIINQAALRYDPRVRGRVGRLVDNSVTGLD